MKKILVIGAGCIGFGSLLASLGGCAVYPAAEPVVYSPPPRPVYVAPAPVYVAPPPVYFGYVPHGYYRYHRHWR